jgi:choline monooxygenase
MAPLSSLIWSYDPASPLDRASTIPASWYIDQRIAALERQTTFAVSWQVVGRAAQVRTPGQFVCATLPSGDPIVVVRGADDVLRGFFNVCRHHAAAVVTAAEGRADVLRCPYHGWTYGLDGTLKGTPDFAGVSNFDRSQHGLVPVRTEVWEQWVFVALDAAASPLAAFLGSDLAASVGAARLNDFHWVEQRRYSLDCNWKVFVDNYLDGGYHVPFLHKGLDSVLSYRDYTIECGERFCLQSSPLVSDGAEPATADVRQGDRARYYWIYPNFMINCYGNAMDTNLVLPRGIDRTDVYFDFYFTDISDAAQNRASIDVSHRIQQEDEDICRSVQRGLASRAYVSGRLSVRREAGEHLFHRLLHGDFVRGLDSAAE